MAKSKRNRAQNKIAGSAHGALVTADQFLETETASEHAKGAWVVRSTLFSAELEEVIEIIARERVYRAMLARYGRRLPSPSGLNPDAF